MPIMSKGGVFNKLEKLLKDFESQRKSYCRKGSVSSDFQKKMDRTFIVWTKHAKKELFGTFQNVYLL